MDRPIVDWDGPTIKTPLIGECDMTMIDEQHQIDARDPLAVDARKTAQQARFGQHDGCISYQAV
jgi:hypothetical protein